MEDQGKRLLLAVGAAFLLMLAWSALFPPDAPEKSDKPPAETETSEPAETPVGDGTGGPGETAPGATAEPIDRGEEQVFTFEFPKFQATLSSYGATLTSWKLMGKQNEDRTGQEIVPLDLVKTGEEEGWRPFLVSFPDSTHDVPVGAEWTPNRIDDKTIEFEYESADLKVVKRFEFVPEEYIVRLRVGVWKLTPGEAKQNLAVSTFAFQKPGQKSGSSFASRVDTTWRASCLVGDEDVKASSLKTVTKSPRAEDGAVKWAGFNQAFFLSALAPKNANKERLTCYAQAHPQRDGVMEMSIEYPTILLDQASAPYSRELVAYLGPKYLDDLEEVANVVGFDPKLDEAVDLGMLALIARPLLWLLKTFHGVVGNWGIAIIMLTIVVQLLTLPWTTKSMKSMKAMAKLRPEIEKIQKKYKDDKQRQQVEMMNLYKAHKVNPLAGCLPMLLQMPIWFALYRSLSVAAELYQAPFIPGWLDDLTAPDPVHVMPVVLTIMMFVQTRVQPNPVESTQQKIMMYGMPIMFGVFSFMFPSGLTLYILTNTFLRTGHQLYLNRTDADRIEAIAKKKAAKAGTVVDATDGDSDADDDGGNDDDGDDDDGASADAESGTVRSAAQNRRRGKKKKSNKKRGGRASRR